MLKKLTLAGIALIASSGIAFADADNMTGTTDTGAAASMSTDASSPEAAPAPQAHKHYKKHKKHKHKRHHRCHRSAPVADSAPMGGYKGEVAAAPCPACMHNTFNTGAYAGFGVDSRVNYLSSPAVYTGIEGTLFGGYSMLWDQVYGALEIFVQDSAEITNYSGSRGGAASSWGYGLSVLPGYLLADNVLGYLRLGVINTHFTTGSSNQTGGQVGLGMETALTPCWDLRGEWIYSFYNSMRAGVPRAQTFNLGLLYKFQL